MREPDSSNESSVENIRASEAGYRIARFTSKFTLARPTRRQKIEWPDCGRAVGSNRAVVHGREVAAVRGRVGQVDERHLLSTIMEIINRTRNRS
jgi:hypothetical protein